MPLKLSRRKFVQISTSTTALTALSGCMFDSAGSHEAGTLVIRNEDSVEHSVTVSVTKTSEDDNNIKPRDQTPEPDSDPIWDREEKLVLEGGEKRERKGFLSETGAFYIEAHSERGTSDSSWLGLYEAADGGVAEDAIYVTIAEGGQVSITTTHSD